MYKTAARRNRMTVLSLCLAFACALGVLSWAWTVRAQAPSAPATAAKKPNIIFILADDFAMNLVPYMQQSPSHGLESMMNEGTTFSHYFVSNSLCCPSRSTIFTGKFPHNTGVFTNTYDPKKGQIDGGFGAFNQNDNQLHTFALALHQGGYQTAMLGKYLNGYLPWETEPYNLAQAWEKEWGWDEWDVAGNGYPEFIF
jgi:N-acetylglucosamine-6-sulfatase